jgi:hypothetical protein
MRSGFLLLVHTLGIRQACATSASANGIGLQPRGRLLVEAGGLLSMIRPARAARSAAARARRRAFSAARS